MNLKMAYVICSLYIVWKHCFGAKVDGLCSLQSHLIPFSWSIIPNWGWECDAVLVLTPKMSEQGWIADSGVAFNLRALRPNSAGELEPSSLQWAKWSGPVWAQWYSKTDTEEQPGINWTSHQAKWGMVWKCQSPHLGTKGKLGSNECGGMC